MEPFMTTLSERFELAIHQQSEAMRKNPVRPDWQQCRRNQCWVVAETLSQLGDHTGAADSATELASEFPESSYDAACLLSRCVSLALRDKRLSDDERQRVTASYAEQAVGFLCRPECPNLQRIMTDGDLALVRGTSQFRRLFAGSRTPCAVCGRRHTENAGYSGGLAPHRTSEAARKRPTENRRLTNATPLASLVASVLVAFAAWNV